MRGSRAGWTLIEFSLVMAIFGTLLALAAPAFVRATSGSADPYQQLSLWFEVLLERTSVRGDVVWVEIDPLRATFKAQRPVVVGGGTGLYGLSDAPQVEMTPIEDPYFPAEWQLPEQFRLIDVQAAAGDKYAEERFIVVVYPNGWIDPVTLHVRDQDEGHEYTGFLNPVTGRIAWRDGYRERSVSGDLGS